MKDNCLQWSSVVWTCEKIEDTGAAEDPAPLAAMSTFLIGKTKKTTKAISVDKSIPVDARTYTYQVIGTLVNGITSFIIFDVIIDNSTQDKIKVLS